MKTLWSDKDLQARQKEEAKKQLEDFQLRKRIDEHVKLFEELIKK